LDKIEIRSGDRAKHKVCGSTVPQLFEFELKEKTFHVHNFVDDKGRVRMATWQFSYEGTPVTYIQRPDLPGALDEFFEYANRLGDGFDYKLQAVITENKSRIEKAQS
jgi:hypothetical protein